MKPQVLLAFVALFQLGWGCAAEVPPAAVAGGATDAATVADSSAGSSGLVDGSLSIDAASAVDAQVVPDATDAAAAMALSLAPKELLAALPDRDFLLINLVVPPKAVIVGTDLSVAATDTAGLEQALKQDKAQKVVFYCMSGKTSKLVMSKLQALGYLNLRDLAGGLMAWQAAGLPTQKP